MGAGGFASRLVVVMRRHPAAYGQGPEKVEFENATLTNHANSKRPSFADYIVSLVLLI